MIPELAYQANGYLKIHTRKGAKAYLAMMRCNGQARFSRRFFRTASAADAYGDRLVARARRMVLTPGPVASLTPDDDIRRGERMEVAA